MGEPAPLDISPEVLKSSDVTIRPFNPELPADRTIVDGFDPDNESYQLNAYSRVSISENELTEWMTGSDTRMLRGIETPTPGSAEKTVVGGAFLYDDDAVDIEQKRRTDQFRELNNLPPDFPVVEMNMFWSEDTGDIPKVTKGVELAIKEYGERVRRPFAVVFFIGGDDIESVLAESIETDGLNEEEVARKIQQMPNERKAKQAEALYPDTQVLTEVGFSYETRIWYLSDVEENETPDFVYSMMVNQ